MSGETSPDAYARLRYRAWDRGCPARHTGRPDTRRIAKRDAAALRAGDARRRHTLSARCMAHQSCSFNGPVRVPAPCTGMDTSAPSAGRARSRRDMNALGLCHAVSLAINNTNRRTGALGSSCMVRRTGHGSVADHMPDAAMPAALPQMRKPRPAGTLPHVRPFHQVLRLRTSGGFPDAVI